jgi:hypothetical protein
LIYSYINTRGRVEIGKTRNCVKTLRPSGVVFPHNFEFSQFPLVLITVYQHGKCFIFVKYNFISLVLFMVWCAGKGFEARGQRKLGRRGASILKLPATEANQRVAYHGRNFWSCCEMHGCHHSRTQSPSYARCDEGLWPNPYSNWHLIG